MAREFAFGANELPKNPNSAVPTACSCPATAAGKEVSGPVQTVAEEYDHYAQNRVRDRQGTIPEEMAEDCWESAVQNFRERAYNAETEADREYFETLVAEGEEVLETVF